MDRKTVFLSSTRSDLHAFRQAASEAIQRLGYYSEEMEVFGARDDSPLEVSLAKVSDSDIYIGLLGVFYGSVPPGHDRSFTEMEFDTAVQAGIPRLMFLTAEDWEPTAAISQTARNRAKQQAFRQRVMQAHTCDTFSSPDELAAKVTSALAQLETKRPRRRLLWPVVALLTLVVALVIVGGLLGVFRDGPEPQNTPVNTQVSSVSSAPAMAITAAPGFTEVVDPRLIGSHVRDVAAADGRAWFATGAGLVEHDEVRGSPASTEVVPDVPGLLETVSISNDGQRVWFSRLDEGVGWFDITNRTGRMFTASEGVPGVAVLHILATAAGETWFADALNEVFSGTVAGDWQKAPPFETDRWRANWLALGEEETLWAATSIKVQRLLDGSWTAYDEDNTDGGLRHGIVNAIAVDGLGYVWFAHGSGLSILV